MERLKTRVGYIRQNRDTNVALETGHQQYVNPLRNTNIITLRIIRERVILSYLVVGS